MARKTTNGQRTAGSLLGFGLQIIPTAYVVATGTVPPWARWTLGVFVAAWLLVTVVNANRSAS